MAAHGKPGVPLLPRIRDSAVVAPKRVVIAGISIKPFSKLKAIASMVESGGIILVRITGHTLLADALR